MNIRRQSGAVLVVSLVLLLIITAIAASTMTSSIFQTKISSNAQQRSTVFTAAESAVEQVSLPLANPTAITSAGTAGLAVPVANHQSANTVNAPAVTVTDLALDPNNPVRNFMAPGTSATIAWKVHPYEIKADVTSADGHMHTEVVMGVANIERGDLMGPN